MSSLLFVEILLYFAGLLVLCLAPEVALLLVYILLLPIAIVTFVISPYLIMAKEKLVYDSPEPVKLRRLINNNAKKLGINKKIKIYVLQSNELNAFIFGIRKANFAITRGCLERLNEKELNALILHELSHVKNKDVWFMTWNVWFIKSAIIWFSFYIFILFYFLFLGSSLSLILVFCKFTLISTVIVIIIPLSLFAYFSRIRELVADANVCAVSGNSSILISVIKKIYRDIYLKLAIDSLWRKKNELFFILVSKMNDMGSCLFSFHPTVYSRIKSIQQKKYIGDKSPGVFSKWISVCFGVFACYIAFYLPPLLEEPHLLFASVFNVTPRLFLKFERIMRNIDYVAIESLYSPSAYLFSHIPYFLVYPPFLYIVLAYLSLNINVKNCTKLSPNILLSWIIFFTFFLLPNLIPSLAIPFYMYGMPLVPRTYSYLSPHIIITNYILEIVLFTALTFITIFLLGITKLLTHKIRQVFHQFLAE